jgi:Holliday junction DNA helicase RuvA
MSFLINYLKGTLEYADEGSLIIEVNGVGYKLAVPLSAMEKLPPLGGELKIYTYLQVKEDELCLYGFLSKEEQSVFEKLITVSGIGPKGAINILSVLSPMDIYMAIVSADIKLLSSVSGIGKKTAQRIVLELKDKMGNLPVMDLNELQTVSLENNGLVEDALSALMALGYKRAEALQAVRQVYTEGMELEAVIKASLKKLSTI